PGVGPGAAGRAARALCRRGHRGAAATAALSDADHGARGHAVRGALSSRRGCRSPPNPRLRSLHSQWRHHPGAPEPGVLLNTPTDPPQRDRWARLRFSIIGPLLAAPPAPGEVHDALATLAARAWRHPISGQDRTLRAVDDRALVLRRAQRHRPDRGAARPATPPRPLREPGTGR